MTATGSGRLWRAPAIDGAFGPRFLPFTPEHADMILSGQKTQTTRLKHNMNGRWDAGTRVRVWKHGRPCCELELTKVTAKRLGELDREDARREGGYTLEEFERVWKRLHRGHWNPEAIVLVLQFRVVTTSRKEEGDGLGDRRDADAQAGTTT